MHILLLFVILVLVQATTPVPIIKIRGNKFYNSSNGEQFFIKGIAYQRMHHDNKSHKPAFHAPYIDSVALNSRCLHDVKVLQELGVNVVRVYQIDPSASHTECMSALSNAGIYVLADLLEPLQSINRQNPYWLTDLYDRYKSVVDAMAHYDNVLGFFVGNEVTTSRANSDALAFVRAAVRDVRLYMKEKKYRSVPLGYASNDDAEIRKAIANYFVCEDKGDTVDFFALNMYEWCGYSSYATSGYRDRTMEFTNYPVPIFFGEYGCNTFSPRPFTEVEALYGLLMSKVWSGGLAYEFFENGNHYGLVQLANLSNPSGSLSFTQDFHNLKLRLQATRPSAITFDLPIEDEPLLEVKCETSDVWNVLTKLPPTPDAGKCECLSATHSCIMNPFHKTDEEQLLNEVCLSVDCLDIEANGATGVYGRYADCTQEQRLSYALNKYFVEKGGQQQNCDFGGRASLITNSAVLDLGSISTKDGRSCEVALGESPVLVNTTQNASSKAMMEFAEGSPQATRHGFNSTHAARSFASISPLSLTYMLIAMGFSLVM